MKLFGRKTVIEEVTTVAPEENPALVDTAPANPVPALAGTAVAVEPVVGDEAARLETLLASLLPIEMDAKSAVETRLELLKASQLPYPRLSLEPLRWRRKGLPVFAIYDLTTPVCSLRGYDNNGRPIGAIPHQLRHILAEGVEYPTSHSAYYFSDYYSRFTGLIPTDVRLRIADAKQHFADDIYIIGEASWNQVEVRIGDPLVVGWKAGALWLVAQFDLTTIEKYVLSEFPG